MVKTIGEPWQIRLTCHVNVRGELCDPTYRTQLADKQGQNEGLAFISTTKKAVHDIQESCLRTAVRTLSRLEVITYIAGQRIVAKLT